MNVKSRMAKKVAALMGMVTDGNKKYKDILDRMNGVIPEAYAKLKPSRRTSTTQGYASRFHKALPNLKKKATKPFTGNGQARNTTMHGLRHHVPAPRIDEVRALEQRTGQKIIVRDAKCYLRNESNIEVPLDADTTWMLTHTIGDFQIQGCRTGRISHS